MERRQISSGSPYEKPIGFSRAIRIGDRILVAGTGPIGPDGRTVPGGALEQARRCLAIIRGALEEAGGSISDVVRTRMFITDRAVWKDVGQAHGEVFGDVRPVATMVVVSGLIEADWLVEIEAEAVAGSGAQERNGLAGK